MKIAQKLGIPEMELKEMLVSRQIKIIEENDGQDIISFNGKCYCITDDEWIDNKWPTPFDVSSNEPSSWDAHKWLDRLLNEDKKGLLVDVYKSTIQAIRNGYICDNMRHIVLPTYDEKANHLYSNEIQPDLCTNRFMKTKISVVNEDCLDIAEKLVKCENGKVAVLNMANRFIAGGGVLYGATGQEETLYRRSNYFLSTIVGNKALYPLNLDYGAFYSENLCIFRGNEMNGYPFLSNPFFVNCIAVAALNRPSLRMDDSGELEYENNSLKNRCEKKIRTILNVAIEQQITSLVLGAFGCGSFKNPPKAVASIFRSVLNEHPYCNAFKEIVFAIYRDEKNYSVFREVYKKEIDEDENSSYNACL